MNNNNHHSDKYPLDNEGVHFAFSRISIEIKSPIQAIMLSPPENRIKTYLSTKKTHLGISDDQRINLIEAALNTADYNLAAFVIDDNQYSMHQTSQLNISFFDILLKHLLNKRQHEKDYPFSSTLHQVERIESLLKVAHKQNESRFTDMIQHGHFQFLEPLVTKILNSPSIKKRSISFKEEDQTFEYEPSSPEPETIQEQEVPKMSPQTSSPRREPKLETYPRSILLAEDIKPAITSFTVKPLAPILELPEEEEQDDEADYATTNPSPQNRYRL